MKTSLAHPGPLAIPSARSQIRRMGWTWIGILAAIAGALHAQETANAVWQPTRDPVDAIACRVHLNILFEAIQEYQSKYGDLPNWFSDLYPEFLENPRLLICPYVQRIEDLYHWRPPVNLTVFFDPLLPTTYTYEFNSSEYPLWTGFVSTAREFKYRQLQVMRPIVGPVVPILRCLAHQATLNVSVEGILYTSEGDWESNFTNAISILELVPEAVFTDMLPPTGRNVPNIPPRDPQTPAQLLDLSDHYHSALTAPWVFRNPPGSDLSALPRGTTSPTRSSVPFDVRGVIQLKSSKPDAPFPIKVDGIPVRQPCKRIHFLHGSYEKTPQGNEIGAFLIHYDNGNQARIPIVYGVHVLSCWWDPSKPAESGPEPAWLGLHPVLRDKPRASRLFELTWDNPQPESPVATLSFLTTQTRAAPFLVAVTVE